MLEAGDSVSGTTHQMHGELESISLSSSQGRSVHLPAQSRSASANASLEYFSTISLRLEHSTSNWLPVLAKVFWQGGSTFDAWLNATSAQTAQVLLTFPYSFAQMGVGLGLAFMLLNGIMGCWASYTITCLYADYRKVKGKQNISFEHHTIQWHEVLEGLLGPWWKVAGLVFNGALLFCTATIQLIACGSTVYYVYDSLDKRSWTLIFGACCSLSILIPSAQNYRMWSFVGIIMTTYTAWYLTIASLMNGKEPGVEYRGPRSMVQYFTGATNFLYAFGGHAVTVEIMDAMWKPTQFKIVYVYAILYIFMLTVPSAITVYLAFGDNMLMNPNAFGVLPRSKYRDAAVVLMLIHQFIEFGLLTLPIYITWEKFLGLHHKKQYIVKVIARVPVILGICFVALMIPFFGPINSTVGSLLTSFSIYIIPCAAHMVFYWSPASRTSATEQPPFWIPNWVAIYCVNFGIILWVLVVGAGFGAWASIQHIKKEIDTFGLFTKCYECNRKLSITD